MFIKITFNCIRTYLKTPHRCKWSNCSCFLYSWIYLILFRAAFFTHHFKFNNLNHHMILNSTKIHLVSRSGTKFMSEFLRICPEIFSVGGMVPSREQNNYKRLPYLRLRSSRDEEVKNLRKNLVWVFRYGSYFQHLCCDFHSYRFVLKPVVRKVYFMG